MNIDLSLPYLVSSVVYTVLGLLLMVIAVSVINRFFGLNLKKELVEDHNVASGVLLAGLFIAIAIIIASAIHG